MAGTYPDAPRRPAEEVRERPGTDGPAPKPARRVSREPNGPFLVEGPVEVVMEDGSIVRSDRPVVALCACRRSAEFPWCDTSHRRRRRPPA
ncbi:CDGSH iron-sulfur domain-containing protein [Streptomyces sp. NPDC021100]|uniref:CDGSH iron-sulfur domain-containing protein n=1 Tax=Streptomyces sp. NPDC021100 TaxID=3365114 RepID=UPI00378C2014